MVLGYYFDVYFNIRKICALGTQARDLNVLHMFYGRMKKHMHSYMITCPALGSAVAHSALLPKTCHA